MAFAGTFTTGSSSPLPQGIQTFVESDHDHVAGPVSYDRVPPAGGAHNAVVLNCGVYSQPVPNENAVHSLEHGAVWITYRPTLPPDQVALLQQFVKSHYVGAGAEDDYPVDSAGDVAASDEEAASENRAQP